MNWAWAWLRQVSGDAAYENYVRCSGRMAPQPAKSSENGRTAQLSRLEFYLESLERRYSSASRCC